MGGGGGGGAPAPKNPWDNLGVNTQQGYGALQSGFNPGANIQQQGASYAQLRNQGFADDAIRSSVQSVYGQQPQDWYAVRRAGGPYEGLGVNTQQGFNTLVGATGQDARGSAPTYNALLRQGFGNEAIRSSASELFGTQSDANWNDIVTQAGLAAGRPLPGSAQFYQPVYQPQYQNYANPYTAFNVSTYGTQPMTSAASSWAAGQGLGQQHVTNSANSWLQQNPGADMNTMLNAMRGVGMNAYDVQGAGGFGNYGPSFGMPQMQTPFNPYTNSFDGFGGGFGGGFGSRGGYSFTPDAPLPEGMVGTMGGRGYDPTTGRSDLGTAGGSGYFTPRASMFGEFGMASPFTQSPQMNMGMQSPFRSSGPAQPIVSRSASMRGTPNVMRRAEGGIASLVGDE